MTEPWIPTRRMAEELGFSVKTLSRLQHGGFFIEDRHYQKMNPLAERSNYMWNRTAVLIKMGRV